MDNVDFIKEFILSLKYELIKYRTVVVSVAIVILLAVMAVGMSWKVQYVSTATMEIDDSNIIQPLLEGRAEFSRTDRVEEAKQTIVSRQLIESVAYELGYINEESSVQDIEKVIDIIRSSIVVESSGQQRNVFFISYYSNDPSVAFESVKVIVSQLVDYHKLARQAEGEEAYSFIASRADVYKKRLEVAEDNLAKYKSEKLDIDEATVQRKISDLEDEIQELRLVIRENESIVRTTRKQLNNESQFLGARSKLFSKRQQQAALERQLSELRTQFHEEYPVIVSVKQQIADLEKEVQEIAAQEGVNPNVFSGRELSNESNPELLFDNLRTQLADTERSLTAQKDRLNSLVKLLSDQKLKMEVVASNEAELAELRRDYNVTRDIYEETLNTQQNAELSVAITEQGLGLAYVVKEPPTFPLNPSGLTFIHFMLAAPILAMGAPIGMLVALILLDPRVRIASVLRGDEFGDGNLLTVSPHFHSAFSDQIFRKDMLVLTIAGALAVLVYVILAISGLKS